MSGVSVGFDFLVSLATSDDLSLELVEEPGVGPSYAPLATASPLGGFGVHCNTAGHAEFSGHPSGQILGISDLLVLETLISSFCTKLEYIPKDITANNIAPTIAGILSLFKIFFILLYELFVGIILILFSFA
jgi:hypothetical protein